MTFVSIKNIDKDLISSFDCGVNELNDFFHKYAKQNDKKNIGKTFVLLSDERIIGYYTLSSAQIAFEEIPDELLKGLPRYPIPCMRIARLAVEKRFQKDGYDALLLKDALLRIVNLSQHTGIYFVLVDAKKESISFYEHYGFVSLKDADLTCLLPVATIKKAIRNE